MIKEETLKGLDLKKIPKRVHIEDGPEYADFVPYIRNIQSNRPVSRNWSKLAKSYASNKDYSKIKRNIGESNKWTGYKAQEAIFKKKGFKKYLRVGDRVKHPVYGEGTIVATNIKTIDPKKIGKISVQFSKFGTKEVHMGELVLIRPKEVKNTPKIV